MAVVSYRLVASEVEQTSGVPQGVQGNTDPKTAIACDEGLVDLGEFSPTNTLSSRRERTALVTLRSDMILGLFALELAICHRTAELISYLRISNLDRDFRPIGALGHDAG
jgi:hypothetical protein